jgi:hypothetical protein
MSQVKLGELMALFEEAFYAGWYASQATPRMSKEMAFMAYVKTALADIAKKDCSA